MRRSYIPFLAFLILFLLAIQFSFDFSNSVVPGWHTAIFPPNFILGLLIIIVLLFVVIGYWLLSKKSDKTSWLLFAIHFLITITTVIYLWVPSIFLNLQVENRNEQIKTLAFRMKLIPLAWAFFIVGQILFLIYYIRILRRKHTIT